LPGSDGINIKSVLRHFCGSLCRLVGDEQGTISVLKYAAEDGKLVDMPYHLNPDCLVGDCKSYSPTIVPEILPCSRP